MQETYFGENFNFAELMPIHGQPIVRSQLANRPDPPTEAQVTEQLPTTSPGLAHTLI